MKNGLLELSEKYTSADVGYVLETQGSIVKVSGLDNAAYYEEVTIEDSAEGYVEAIDRKEMRIALTKVYKPIYNGDRVFSSNRTLKMKFSESSVGHIVDMFGKDKLNDLFFSNAIDLEVETPAIPIVERGLVERPLLTGIKGIDLLFPIGKGQRQLIIGDKKTGKTQIALDIIANQKRKDVLCIFVAIGKTKKEVKEIYSSLVNAGAIDYTIIMAAFNDEQSPVIINTPYAALSVAEYYMKKGIDVLVVIDDLKQHADACRSVSLLQGGVPGREAYPPDIFYRHSRLLEKGCQHINGGSISILPICETTGSDISDYISTNIISITDGQIVLSTKNFEKGQKPAIHYGLSVSRLGGAVQDPKLKIRGNKIKSELLTYMEQAEVYELANVDMMNKTMRDKMIRGASIVEKLKQYKYNPKTPTEMIEEFADLYEVKL